MSSKRQKGWSFTENGPRRGRVVKKETSNKFENDGSFMKMFKKMTEQQQETSKDQSYMTEASSSSSTQSETPVREKSIPETAYVAPQAIMYKSGTGEDKVAPKQPRQVDYVLIIFCIHSKYCTGPYDKQLILKQVDIFLGFFLLAYGLCYSRQENKE